MQLLGLGNKAPKLGRITEVGATYLVYEAYAKLIAEEDSGSDCSFVTDDAMVVERYFREQRVLLTEGSYTNIKVTTPEDLQYARALLHARM